MTNTIAFFLCCFSAAILLYQIKVLFRINVDINVFERFPLEKHEMLSTDIQLENLLFYTEESHWWKNLSIFCCLEESSFKKISDYKIVPSSARIVAEQMFYESPLVLSIVGLQSSIVRDLKNILIPFGILMLEHKVSEDIMVDSRPESAADGSFTERYSSVRLGEIDPDIGLRVDTKKVNSTTKTDRRKFCGCGIEECGKMSLYNNKLLMWHSKGPTMDSVIEMKKFRTPRFDCIADGLDQRVPLMLDYSSTEYSNEYNEFLFLRFEDVDDSGKRFLKLFDKLCEERRCLKTLKRLGEYEVIEAAKYRGIVYLPTRLSDKRILEVYRTNTPIFVPSLDLLVKMQDESNVIRNSPSNSLSDVGTSSTRDLHRYWIGMADIYQSMPHCLIYNNMSHLITLLENVDDILLMETSESMNLYNIEFKKRTINKWKNILLTIRKQT